MLVDAAPKPSNYGVVVCDDRTGRVQHFVEKPETFVSDLINAGVYVFSPSFLARIPAGEKVSMNQVLPKMALEEQVQSHLLTGYWVRGRLPQKRASMPRSGPAGLLPVE